MIKEKYYKKLTKTKMMFLVMEISTLSQYQQKPILSRNHYQTLAQQIKFFLRILIFGNSLTFPIQNCKSTN